jgi:8-oxo-dGTP pyrophosphatase MutT (NUDIX family)
MTIKQRTVFRGRVITVNVETVRLPNGVIADLEITHHPGGAAVVAIDTQDRVCLLHHFRHAASGWVWELPAGKLDPGESPLSTAQRELVEEAGVSALEWQSLGIVLSSPGVFTEVVHLVLARELEERTATPEASEVFESRWVPLAEALARALDGDITDAKTVIGLCRAANRLRDREAR